MAIYYRFFAEDSDALELCQLLGKCFCILERVYSLSYFVTCEKLYVFALGRCVAEDENLFCYAVFCIEDAEYLAERIKNEIGVKEVRIAYVGSVIGSHSGPGTLALFFLGSER